MLLAGVLKGCFARCCPCYLTEAMESSIRTHSEPKKYRYKMCFESHVSCGHCRGSEPGWGALRDGFVQGCWDVGSVTLKGNNGTKPLEKCACWTSEKESPGQVVGLFLVSSCDGCPCNLLRQVAWLMVAAAVLGGGGRLKTHISATTSHGQDRGANQQVGAQEWAGPPEVPHPHTCPDPFPSCSELWDRERSGEEEETLSLLSEPQDMCKGSVQSRSWNNI